MQGKESNNTQDKTIEQNNFKEALKDFQQLSQHKQLPPKMDLKLRYLLAMILNHPINQHQYTTLAPYEVNSLKSICKSTQIELFCNIVNCLSGKEIIMYFKDQKAYIRKQQFFSMWSECFITCDSKKILIKKKPNKPVVHQFVFGELKISKSHRIFKGKSVFGIICKNQKYLFGFNAQSSCQRIHSIIRQIVREKHQSSIAPTQQTQKVQKLEPIVISKTKKQVRIQKKQQLNESFQLQQQEMNQQQELSSLIELLKKVDFNSQEDYELYKNFENGRILVNKKDMKKTKAVLLFQNITPQNVIESFVRINQWNEEFQEAKIINKLGFNTYIVYFRLKKSSWIAYQRETVILISSVIIANKYYVIFKSVPHELVANSKNVVFDYQLMLQIGRSQQNPQISLMSILMTADFKGFNSDVENRKSSLSIFQHLQHLKLFCVSRQMIANKKHLFNFQSLSKRRKLSFMQSEVHEKNPYYNGSELSNFQDSDPVSSPSSLSKNMKLQSKYQFELYHKFADFMKKSIQKDPQINEQLILMIRQRIFQHYYLKHKFDQQPAFDPQRLEYKVNGKDNFVEQNGNWLINQNGDAIFTNEEQIQVQKNIIKYILKQIGSNLMSGKSIMNMSLPVEIFAGDSLLSRLISGFGFLPKYFPQAAKCTNPIQQIKLVTLYYLGMSTLHLRITKPFNPIIGQTFECSFGGIPVYSQQVSHHPPIGAFYSKTQDFEYYGNFNSHVEMGFNSCHGKNLGTHKIKFLKTNTHYQVKMIELDLGGLLYGQRTYRPSNKCFAFQKTNRIYMQYSVGKEKKKVYEKQKGKVEPVDVLGGIYQVSHAFVKRFQACEAKYQFDGIRPEQIVDKYCQINGKWLGDIFFDGKKVKSIFDPLPNKMQYQNYVLPSDSNLRLDLIYRRINKLPQSQQQKQILQNIQRRDRKLRIQKQQVH